MSRLLLILIAACGVLAAATGDGGATGQPGVDCGTCDSLGYTCVAPNTALVDLCGVALTPGHCPIPSCQEYCLRLFGANGGQCDDKSHLCDCGPAGGAGGIQTSIFSPVPSAPAPKAHKCTTPPLTCATMTRAWKCIPENTVDMCTRAHIPLDFCAPALPDCNTQCATPNGTSTCPSGGLRCQCNATTATGGSVNTTVVVVVKTPLPKKPAAKKPTVTAAKKPPPPKVLSALSAAATVDTPIVSELSDDGTVSTLSTPAIWALAVLGSLLGVALLAMAIVAWQKPAARNSPKDSRGPRLVVHA